MGFLTIRFSRSQAVSCIRQNNVCRHHFIASPFLMSSSTCGRSYRSATSPVKLEVTKLSDGRSTGGSKVSISKRKRGTELDPETDMCPTDGADSAVSSPFICGLGFQGGCMSTNERMQAVGKGLLLPGASSGGGDTATLDPSATIYSACKSTRTVAWGFTRASGERLCI